MNPTEYDGFYFLPCDEDDELLFSYFSFDGDLANSKKVKSNNSIGDIWHIAFFTKGEKGNPIYNDSFEAILSDPKVYAQNFCGTGLYGCVLRKTDKSVKWFNDYLNKIKNHVIILRLK